MTKISKGRLIKRILLGIFFAVGSAIIALAAIVVMNIFLADDINTKELTGSFEDFKAVYDEYPSMRDLPDGLEVTSSVCHVNGNIFSYELKIKNSSDTMSEYALQLYYSEELMELKPRAMNPFIREYSDDGLMILAGETKEFTITGTLGSDASPEEFAEAMDHIYLEVIYADEAGRIMLPVNVSVK